MWAREKHVGWVTCYMQQCTRDLLQTKWKASPDTTACNLNSTNTMVYMYLYTQRHAHTQHTHTHHVLKFCGDPEKTYEWTRGIQDLLSPSIALIFLHADKWDLECGLLYGILITEFLK